LNGRKVTRLCRIGKRIAIGLEPDFWLVLHLMIAGRLHWHARPPKLSKRVIAGFDFSTGSLSLTEAGSKRRASLHVMHGEQELRSLHRSEPYAQEGSHRPAHFQRDWQCLFG
jgi:formamidopyrimidine-DNA glycosylase